MRHLNRLFDIREGEGKPLALLVTYFFFFGATLTVTKTARDAYFLSRFDVTYLPLMFLAAACAVALTVIVYNWVLRRARSLMSVICSSGLIFALTLVMIQFRLQGGVIPLLYVWVDVINTVISVQFWVLAAMVFNSRQARRLFGIILVGSLSARMTIGAGITPYVGRFGADYLLSLAAGFILCCVLMAWLVEPYAQLRSATQPSRQKESGESGFFDGYMKTMAIAVGAAAVATVIIEYQFLIISKNHFGSEERLASFFGLFYSLTGLFSLFVQIFLTGWILTRLGILWGMVALPAGLGLGSLAVLISPLLLLSSLIAKASEQITKFTLNKTSFELLWVPVSPERKLNRKLFIDGTVRTGLQGLTGVMIFVLLKVWQLPYSQLMQLLGVLALTSIGIWASSLRRLKRGYISELTTAIEKRRLDFEHMRLDTTDGTLIATIEKTLNGDDEAQRIFALDLIAGLQLAPWQDTLANLFQTGTPAVRQKLLAMAEDRPAVLPNEELVKLIEDGGQLAADATILAGKREMIEVIPALSRLLKEPDSVAVDISAAAAVATLMMNGGPLDLAHTVLQRLLDRKDEPSKVLCLQMIAHIPSWIENAQLLARLESGSIPVCVAALDIAQKKSDVQLLPAIVRSMTHHKTAEKARVVLEAYPAADVLAVLCRICVDPETPLHLRIEIIKSLKGYPGPDAALCLVRMLELPDLCFQSESVRALLAMARMGALPGETLARLSVKSEQIAREIYAYYGLLSMTVEDRDSLLLRDLYRSHIRELTPVLFILLLLHKPEAPVETYIAHMQSEDETKSANLVEIVDNMLPRRESGWLAPLLRPVLDRDRSRAGRRLFAGLPSNLDDELLTAMLSPNEWKAAVALDYALRQGNRGVLERIDWMSFPGHRLQQELISRCLQRKGGLFEDLPQFPRAYFQAPTKELSMLSTLEKTIILKGTGLFEDVPGEEIFHVAQVTEEERLDPGSVLFSEGGMGDYLYVIVSGEIRIHKEETEVNRHGKGEAFGEMGVLDDTARSTSATAVGETLLLKISQQNFYDIMMGHPEVTRGIVKMLTSRLRRLTEKYADAECT